jgi:hypothetical protein
MTSRNWLYRIDVATVAYGMDSSTAVRALCTNPAGYVSLPQTLTANLLGNDCLRSRE